MARRSKEQQQAQDDYYAAWVRERYPDPRGPCLAPVHCKGCMCRPCIERRKRRGREGRMYVSITLNETQWSMARDIGRQRQEAAGHMPEKHGQNRDPLQVHVEGAGGEYAAALAVGLPWPAHVNAFRGKPDLGPLPWRAGKSEGTEVKDRSRSDYELIIRDDDRPGRDFVLVTGTGPEFVVVGWFPHNAERDTSWLQTHGGRERAWFVPHTALEPFPTEAP